MRSPRRDDVGVLGFTGLMLLPVIFGGWALIWFAFDRYPLGGPGAFLGGLWAYSWLGVLRQTIEAILEDDGLPEKA